MRPTRPSASRGGARRGLTLVEVLIALTLLVVVLLPIMVGFSQSLVATSDTAVTAAAASIARAALEELKGADFDALASAPPTPADLRPGDSFFEVTVLVVVARPDEPAGSGLKRAEVAVYRRGATSPVVTLSTYLTPFGI